MIHVATMNESADLKILIHAVMVIAHGFDEAALIGLIEATAGGADRWVSLNEKQIERFAGIPADRQTTVVESMIECGLIAYGIDPFTERDGNHIYMSLTKVHA